jgi:predicted phosphodiesterase
MANQNEGAVWVILADIHANYPAFEKVWEDARNEAQAIGISPDELRWISLGDVVDYGPDPVACLKWVEDHCVIKLRGNHDFECSRHPLALPEVRRVSSSYWPVTVWTRCELEQAALQHLLSEWPLIAQNVPGLPESLLAHANFSGDADQCLKFQRRPSEWVYENFIQPLQQSGARYGFIGHSHVQMIFQYVPGTKSSACTLLPDSVAYAQEWRAFPAPAGSLFLINPGSVGQPRKLDESAAPDYRAKYMLLDTRDEQPRYKFRRVAYPMEKTAEALDQNVVLPDHLADLAVGAAGERDVLLNESQIEALHRGLKSLVFRLKLSLGIEEDV